MSKQFSPDAAKKLRAPLVVISARATNEARGAFEELDRGVVVVLIHCARGSVDTMLCGRCLVHQYAQLRCNDRDLRPTYAHCHILRPNSVQISPPRAIVVLRKWSIEVTASAFEDEKKDVPRPPQIVLLSCLRHSQLDISPLLTCFASVLLPLLLECHCCSSFITTGTTIVTLWSSFCRASAASRFFCCWIGARSAMTRSSLQQRSTAARSWIDVAA